MRKDGTSINQLERETIMKYVDGNFIFSHECRSGMLHRGLSVANVMESLANGDILEYVFEGNKNRIIMKSRMRFSGRHVLVTLQLKSREILSAIYEDERETPDLSEYSSKLDIMKNMTKYA